MALNYKMAGKTLLDVIEEIYQEHGYYTEDLVSITLKGIEGEKKIKEIVSIFREQPPKEINGVKVEWLEDYLISKRVNLTDGRQESIALPKSNVIKLLLADNSWIAIRPSGTEPKLKFYFAAVADTYKDSLTKLDKLKAVINNFIS